MTAAAPERHRGAPAYTAEQIALVCHEANRALQAVNGDPCLSLPWDEEPEEVHRFAVAAVEFALRGGAPEEQFRDWRGAKAAKGWAHGPVKDARLKTHPCMVPDYADLPAGERAKDVLFAAVIAALAGRGDGAPAGPVPTKGELVAFGLLLERAERALTEALERAKAAEAERDALADSTGALVAAAGTAERERLAAVTALCRKARDDASLAVGATVDVPVSAARILAIAGGGTPAAHGEAGR